ncbi:MAG TPA: hypothetical protein VLT32_02710 [Candidatus Sulfomarinibacteraceae bacterium]|nr:hypothetical protein [Candidatus Sulfomarinibacteraceae bacterium]
MTETRLSSRSRNGLRIVWRGAVTALVALPLSVAAAGPPAGVSPDEWAGIEQQIEAERHKVAESDRPGRLWRAANPTQRFTAHFGAEDVLLLPAGRGEPGWQLGLRLAAWGAARDLQPVPPAGAIADGNRVEYRRGPVTEWYVNTAMGLEQGFTIAAPPGDDIGELVLEMTIEGDLTAELAENAAAVSFRHKDSNTTLNYSGLKAWDAVEEPLGARMELVGGGTRLRLVVGVVGAAWPITIDPTFTLAARLLPTPHLDLNGASFGASIAMDGDLMVVGQLQQDGWGPTAGHVFRRDLAGSGDWVHVAEVRPDNRPIVEEVSVAISGDTIVIGTTSEHDDGSVGIFVRNHGGTDAWGQVAHLTDTSEFGWSVDIDGDTVVVGAPRYSHGGTPEAGAAFVFYRNAGGLDAWGQVAMLANSTPFRWNLFGLSVAIETDTVLVGAPGRVTRAFVFGRDHGGPDAWGQVAEIYPTGTAGRYFGTSVAVSGDTAVVGQPDDNENGFQSGSAHIYKRDQGGTNAWGQVTRLIASDASEYARFGWSVAISGDTAAIGAYGDRSNGPGAGSVYLYRRDQGGPETWGEVTKLVASDHSPGDGFGYSVAINGDTAVAGARWESGPFVGSGSAYVFRRDEGGAGAWGQLQKIPCPPIYSALMDHFGQAVAVSHNTLVVGAPDDEDRGMGFGTAHVFERDQGGSDHWGLVATLSAEEPELHDQFAASLAVSGDILIVGAYQDNRNGTHSGTAYVFERDRGGTNAWGQVTELTPNYAYAYALFGISVSVDGDTAAVGTPGTGVQGGVTYIFQRDHGGPDAWGRVAELRPVDLPSTQNRFGWSTAISGDTVISGAPWNGTAYVFERDHGGPDAWGQVAKIVHPVYAWTVALDADTALIDGRDEIAILERDEGGPDAWGEVATIPYPPGAGYHPYVQNFAISGDTLVIGAPDDMVGGLRIGSTYVFRRHAGGPNGWGQVARVTAFDGQESDRFGSSVAVDGDTLVAGASNSNQLGLWSGSAYIFTPHLVRVPSYPRRVVPDADP